MKNVILAISLVILANLACGASSQTSPVVLTDPQAAQTRTVVVDTNQESFFAPETWQEAPASCVNSMTLVLPKEDYSSSGTIITEEKWLDSEGNIVWVYYLMVSKHAVGDKLKNEYILIPGTNLEKYQDYTAGFVNYKNITSPDDTAIDVGILSTLSLKRITRDDFKPLGVDKIKTGEDLTVNNNYYFTFGYPASTITAQFSKSKIIEVVNQAQPHIIIMDPENTTTEYGSSGGATCDQSGNLVAILYGHEGEEPTQYLVIPLPTNIQEQVSIAFQETKNILMSSGLHQEP